ncbi:MAG: cytochrome b/b6 domain-containing protein [Pseudomonadota bacterium]
MTRERHNETHSWLARLFHWGFIVVLAVGLIRQIDEVEELDDVTLLIEETIFALVFLVLLLFRFLYMTSRRREKLHPGPTPRLLRIERAIHLGMYLSLSALAVTGLMIGGLYASTINAPLTFAFVLWSHEASYWVSVNLIIAHVAFAIYHRLRRDGVWSSMVPVFTEKPEEARAQRTRKQREPVANSS